jgi:hypothetical protein
MTRRRSPTSASRRGSASPEPLKKQQFQVLLTLAALDQLTQEELEETFANALATLVDDAHGVVLGPAGGVDFKKRAVELIFTVEAVSPAVFYAKMGEVLRLLELGGFEYEGSTEARLDNGRCRELEPAL